MELKEFYRLFSIAIEMVTNVRKVATKVLCFQPPPPPQLIDYDRTLARWTGWKIRMQRMKRIFNSHKGNQPHPILRN